MTIIQGLIASITNGAATPPPFVPSDTNQSLGANWTVELIAELAPTQFWATIWGNEVWNTSSGHLAYLTAVDYLQVGAPNGLDEYQLADNVSVRSHWSFTHTDGSGIDVYRNGVLLTKTVAGYVQPSAVANNTLIFGARHLNDGSGLTDTCSGTYLWNSVNTSTALDSTAIQASYDSLKGTYGLP